MVEHEHTHTGEKPHKYIACVERPSREGIPFCYINGQTAERSHTSVQFVEKRSATDPVCFSVDCTTDLTQYGDFDSMIGLLYCYYFKDSPTSKSNLIEGVSWHECGTQSGQIMQWNGFIISDFRHIYLDRIAEKVYNTYLVYAPVKVLWGEKWCKRVTGEWCY